MEINTVVKAAELLEKSTDIRKLARLKELMEKQRFYITFWGHYSAGKSKLINSIFEKELLPVQTRETTAVLTYIQYGTQEECVLIYEDGTASNHDIGILKDIFQNTGRFDEINKLDHIEVYVKDELLRTGLVLVDTPGVNTVLRKHQELAADAMEQSGRIIYVLGNASTNVDRQFIKQISDCGIKISFVRTKCDRFVEEEENPEVSLKKEEDDIMSFLEESTEFIPVSNEKESKWYANIGKVRELLGGLSERISEEMQQAYRERLALFASQYIEEMKIEEEQLEEVIDGDINKINAEIEKCETDIEELEKTVSNIENNVNRSINDAKNESKKEIDKLILSRTEEFTKVLSGMEAGVNAADEVQEVYTHHVSVTAGRLQRILNSHFEKILADEIENLTDSISDKSIEIALPRYTEVQQENSSILEIYGSKLTEVKQQIERTLEEMRTNGETAGVLQGEFNEADYEEALAVLNRELAEIPSGMALKVAEHQDIQPSAVFRGIGDAADIALLLLPGDVIFKGIKAAANTTKIAQILHKMGKAGQVIVKAGQAVGKNAKVIDRVRDTVYAVNTIAKKRGYSTQKEKEAAQKLVDKVAKAGQDVFETYKEEKKSGSILDALSVTYWTEKFGKQFDSAPRMEIDREEEERRKQLRNQIMQQQQQLSEERMRKKKELGLLSSKEAELKVQAQEEELKRQKIEEEMRRQEELLKRKARQAAMEKYCNDYRRYYEERIRELADDMMSRYFRTASGNITMYITIQSKEVLDDIELKKNKMKEWLELKENGTDEARKKLSEYRKLRDELERNE